MVLAQHSSMPKLSCIRALEPPRPGSRLIQAVWQAGRFIAYIAILVEDVGAWRVRFMFFVVKKTQAWGICFLLMPTLDHS